MDSLYTSHDAAKILQVHPFTVAKWIGRGLLKSWRTAGGHRRIQGADLRAYLVEQALPVPPELKLGDTRLRMLVVDDEPIALRAIQRAFKPFDAEAVVTTTSSGVDALLLLGDTKPDAALRSFFSRPFSVSSCLRRLVSATSIAPKRFRQDPSLHQVPLLPPAQGVLSLLGFGHGGDPSTVAGQLQTGKLEKCVLGRQALDHGGTVLPHLLGGRFENFGAGVRGVGAGWVWWGWRGHRRRGRRWRRVWGRGWSCCL